MRSVRYSGSAVEVGNRVRYTTQWCRSTSTFTGPIPFARGTVRSIDGAFASVEWDSPDGVPDKVHVGNLERVR